MCCVLGRFRAHRSAGCFSHVVAHVACFSCPHLTGEESSEQLDDLSQVKGKEARGRRADTGAPGMDTDPGLSAWLRASELTLCSAASDSLRPCGL